MRTDSHKHRNQLFLTQAGAQKRAQQHGRAQLLVEDQYGTNRHFKGACRSSFHKQNKHKSAGIILFLLSMYHVSCNKVEAVAGPGILRNSFQRLMVSVRVLGYSSRYQTRIAYKLLDFSEHLVYGGDIAQGQGWIVRTCGAWSAHQEELAKTSE